MAPAASGPKFLLVIQRTPDEIVGRFSLMTTMS